VSTILIVEDDPVTRNFMVQVLTGEGFRIFEADTPAEALLVCQALRDHPLDLLIADHLLPRGNGRELAEHLRRINPATRLIFMSGYSDDPLLNRIEQLSVFLAKPFTLDSLTAKVREVLDGGAPSGGR